MKRVFPFLEWLPQYSRKDFLGDLPAGITVGVMLIPQGMAYAMIAGLPPVYGLYAALIPQVIYGFLGTSRQLAIGPVALDSLLVASGLSVIAATDSGNYIALAISLAFMVGVIQFVLGIARFGFLVNFLSKPVISGFTSAAALIIALNQIKHLIGAPIERGSRIQDIAVSTFEKADYIHGTTVAIAAVCIAVLVLLKRFKGIPSALVAVLLGLASVYFFDLDQEGVGVVGFIPEGLPAFSEPIFDWEVWQSLLPIAITLALIGYMEAISMGKIMEERRKAFTIRPNQELVALGTSNMLGSLFQAFPVTGGLSRTAVNERAGAQTGVASWISAIVVGAVLLFLTPVFYYLPNAVLGAIISVAVLGLVDFRYPARLWTIRKEEFVLWLTTFVVTLTIGITTGIVSGVILSILLLVYRTMNPHIARLAQIGETTHYKNVNRFETSAQIDPRVLAMRFDGQLYFANQEYFKEQVDEMIRAKGPDLKLFVLNAEPVNYIDSSATFMLERLINDLRDKDIAFAITGAIGPVRDILKKTGLATLIGEENIFVSTHDAVEYFFNTSDNKTYKLRGMATQTKKDSE